jgi:hypothetical protein
MDRHGHTRCTPRQDPTIGKRRLVELTAGYVLRSEAESPYLGDRGPWRAPRNYLVDALSALRIPDPALEMQA